MTEQLSKSERTCVGCGKRAAPGDLVRLVLGPVDRVTGSGAVAPRVAVDAAGGAFGRGAHVHASPDCVERACRSGLSRAFKTSVVADASELGVAIRDAYERRAAGMLLGARRAGHLELGADAAARALADGAPLVLLAADAGTVSKGFAAAIAAGRAVCFGTKAALGEMFGTGETAVLAVRHQGVAEALQHTLLVAASVVGSERQNGGAGER